MQQQYLQIEPSVDDIESCGNERERAQLDWNWLERWMSSQSHHVRPHETPPYTITTTVTDDMSEEKTVEMDTVAPRDSTQSNMGLVNQDLAQNFHDSSPISKHHYRHDSAGVVPGYMAQTQSAKAKVRSQGPFKQRASSGLHWNSSARSSPIGLDCDSSNSGGATTTQAQMFQRSPSPKINGIRHQSKRISGVSPDNGGVEDWAIPLGAHGWTRFD